MAASDEQERPAKKKRKIRDSRSILEDAKRSDIKLCSTEQVVGNWKDRELWVFQLPKDVSLEWVHYYVQNPRSVIVNMHAM